jgi:hypothetical protein
MGMRKWLWVLISHFTYAYYGLFSHMIERRSGTDKKRSFKNLIHQKRRYVTLTGGALILPPHPPPSALQPPQITVAESVLSWQKLTPGTTPTTSPPVPKALLLETERVESIGKQHSQRNRLSSPAGSLTEIKGEFRLTDVSSVSVLPDAKNSFRVATSTAEVHFQAQSQAEMNEWVVLIQRQQRRHMMMLNRTPLDLLRQGVPLIDLERELHTIHTQFVQHLELLHQWRLELEGGGDLAKTASTLPLNELFPFDPTEPSSVEEMEYKTGRVKLHETLLALISAIEHVLISLEKARCRATEREKVEKGKAMSTTMSTSQSAATSTMVDDANYLHLSSGYKRVRKQPFNTQPPPAATPPPL